MKNLLCTIFCVLVSLPSLLYADACSTALMPTFPAAQARQLCGGLDTTGASFTAACAKSLQSTFTVSQANKLCATFAHTPNYNSACPKHMSAFAPAQKAALCTKLTNVVISTFTGSEDTTTQIANPGTGLQTNNITASATNNAGSNPNSYPFRSMLYREGWPSVESARGTRDFTAVRNKLNDAATDDQVLNYRMYTWDPGSGTAAPTFVYTQAGWKATHDDGNCGGTCNVAYMGDTTNVTDYSNTLGAYATLCNGIASCGALDTAWGAYDEATYSGSQYVSNTTGTAPVPTVGAELTNLTTPQIDALYAAVRAAIPIATYPYFRIATAIDTLEAFVNGFGTQNFGARQDCFGYKKTTNLQCTDSATTGTYGGVQMCRINAQAYAGNQNVATNYTPAYPNAYLTQPIIEEICGTFAGTWGTTYDSLKSFTWATLNHVSEMNVKSGFNPASGTIRTDMEAWMLTAGYRLFLQSASFLKYETANQLMTITTNWKNAGNAPNYRDYRIAFKLVSTTDDTDTWQTVTTTVANWAAGSSGNAVVSTITPPLWLNRGTYTVKVGLVNPTWGFPEVQLAQSGLSPEAPKIYWYTIGTIELQNANVTANPSRNYSSGMSAANLQYLSTPDSTTNSLGSDTDLTGCTWVYITSKAASRPIYEKAASSGGTTTEYRLRYDQASDRFVFFLSDGTNSGSVTANNFGSPTINTWYFVCAGHRATADELFIEVNHGTANTQTWTTGTQNTANPLFFGTNGARNLWMDGRIGNIYLWKTTNPSATVLGTVYSSGSAKYCSELSTTEKTNMIYCADMNEPTNNRRYMWPNLGSVALVNHWGVTQAAGPH